MLFMIQCMYVEVRPHIRSAKMLTLIDGLCCVGIINPTGVVAGVRRQRPAFFLFSPPEWFPLEDGD
jgi:hypothetical protein